MGIHAQIRMDLSSSKSGIFAIHDCTAIRSQHGGRFRSGRIPAPPRRRTPYRHYKPPLARSDAVGTSLALARYLRRTGKEVTCILPDAPDEALDWMPGIEDIVLFEREPGKAQDALHGADVLFALDYNGMNRLGPMSDAAGEATGTWLMVDHHMGPEAFPAAKVHDARCSSTAELLYGVIAGLGGPQAVDAETAALLYAGMMTDTGSFRFGSVSAETHRVVAEMMDQGLEHTHVHEAIYGEQSMDRMKLHAFAVVERMEVFPEFQTAFIHLTAEDMERFNYRAGYTEGLVNKACLLYTSDAADE